MFFPDITRVVLGNPEFNLENIDGITNKKVRTFFAKLHDVVINGMQVVGTEDTLTDTLVDDLLRIVELNDWPLRVRSVSGFVSCFDK